MPTTIWRPGTDAGTYGDSYINQLDATQNVGAAGSMIIGVDSGSEYRMLFKLDLTSSNGLISGAAIPANATITDAKLRLVCSSAVGGGVTCNVHRVTETWVEGTGTLIAPDTTNGVSWTRRGNSGVNWETAGGDYDPTPIASFTLPTGAGAVEIDITDAVQDAVNRDGLLSLIFLLAEASGTVAIVFRAREYTTESDRPTYTVEWEEPAGEDPSGGASRIKNLLKLGVI